MRGRTWGLVLLGSALAMGSAAPRAVAAPDATEPSVCAPPCPDGQICVGQACVTPGRRAAPPPPRHLKRRFFAMPFAGVHSYQHSEASHYDPGARVGALLGGRIGDVASLNGEIAVNVSNVHGVPSGVSYEETNVVVGFSPF